MRKQLQTKPFQIAITIHKDVAERLPAINSELARQAREILELNKSERHIRGGLATREKYLHLHNAHT
ncbi:MAG TPA: hypothetical protein DCY19_04750 [Eubacterium sp.]|nr:hypothetical protein [Eubacterium sp.]